jgi:hypothetical protein
MVCTALNGFSERSNTFVKGLVSKENSPNWGILCDDFIQEETREEALCSKPCVDDKNRNEEFRPQSIAKAYYLNYANDI